MVCHNRRRRRQATVQLAPLHSWHRRVCRDRRDHLGAITVATIATTITVGATAVGIIAVVTAVGTTAVGPSLPPQPYVPVVILKPLPPAGGAEKTGVEGAGGATRAATT